MKRAMPLLLISGAAICAAQGGFSGPGRYVKRGTIDLPFPHAHNYNAEFDHSENKVLGRFKWEHFDLQPGNAVFQE